MRYLILPLFFLLLTAVGQAATPCSSLVKNVQGKNFTWTFNSGGGDAQCGQFANLDWWVAPAVGQTTVTITGITTTSSNSISADSDPVMESMGLLSGANSYGNYNAAQNIIPNLPISYSGINSIVTAMERNEAVDGACGDGLVGECALVYAVLTVMPSVPANDGADMIRPNITSPTKVTLTWDDFDLTRLPSKTYFTGTDAAGIEVIRERWSHNTEIIGLKTNANYDGYSEGGQAFRASMLADVYGTYTGNSLVGDMATLMSDDNTLAEKKPALAAILSYGLDIHVSVFDPSPPYDRFWGQGAGQSAGKIHAPVLLAALLIDPAYQTAIAGEKDHLTEYDSRHGPQELGQIKHGADTHPLWGDDKYGDVTLDERSYWGALIKRNIYDGNIGVDGPLPSNKEGYDPYEYIDGPPHSPGAGYMPITMSAQRALLAITWLVPGACEAINTTRLEKYVNDMQAVGLQTASDPCVTPDSRDVAALCTPYPSLENCTYYGTTWGPDGTGDCIKTPNAYNEVGRYKSFDGIIVDGGNTPAQIIANWATIQAESVCGSSPPVPARRGAVLIWQ